MDDYAFIQAGLCDLPALYDLFDWAIRVGSTCWNENYPGRELPREDVERGWLYLLKQEGELIAALALLPEDDLDDAHIPWTKARSCVLARLCVRPDRQRQGLAQLILKRAGRLAKEMGYASLRLLCDLNNPAALHIYAKLGYRDLGRVALYGNDYAAFEMILG